VSRAQGRSTPGRPRRLYNATEGSPTTAQPGGYRLLPKQLEATSPEVTRDAAAAGVRAGRGRAATRIATRLSTGTRR
jgi:hypothetical protein